MLQVNKLILDHEVARQMEEPAVQQLDAEVKDLRQTIQNYNKQQMSLKTMAKALKEKTDAINDKVVFHSLHSRFMTTSVDLDCIICVFIT